MVTALFLSMLLMTAPAETVFAMEGTSPGIKVGTAISLLVAKKS